MSKSSKLIGKTFGWNSIGFLFSLGNGIITARLLFPEDRGMLAIVLTATALLGTVSSLGTNVSFRVHFPRRAVSAKQYFKVGGLLAPLNMVLVIAFCFIYGSLYEPRLTSSLFILLVLWLGISSFISLQLYDYFNASGETAFSASLSTIGSLFVMLLLLAAIPLSPDIIGVLLAYAIGNSLRVLVGCIVIFRRWRHHRNGTVESANESAGFHLLFTSGRRLLGLNLGQSLIYQSDRFFVGAISGNSALGQYAVAATPVNVPRVLSGSIGQVLFRKAAVGELRLRETVFYSAIALLQTGVIAVGLSLTAHWLIPLIFGDQYIEAVPILRVLLLAEVLLSPYLVLSRVAAGLGMVNVAGMSGVLGLILMLVMLATLVPAFGAIGAAYSSVIVFGLMSVFTSFMVIRAFRQNING